MVTSAIEIAGRRIGSGHPCFIIAEAGVNHNGRLEHAKQLIDAAVTARADAVKFQTFNAERLATATAPKAPYQQSRGKRGESQLDMLRRLELPTEAFRELRTYCDYRSIMFLSTPFDEVSANLLDELGIGAFKIGSGEITNWPLLEHIARKGHPIILSTGMADLHEVADAVRVLRAAGATALVLLHCVSSYPAKASDANLLAMRTLASTFDVPVGYSDHTLGIEVAIAAVALGACMVEKHLTLDRSLPGPDHAASLEPDEFAQLVAGIRTVEVSLGDGRKQPSPREAEIARAARKSLVAARDIRAGTPLTEELVVIKRPGTGLPPGARAQIIGCTAKVNIPSGTILTWDMVANVVEQPHLKTQGAQTCRSS